MLLPVSPPQHVQCVKHRSLLPTLRVSRGQCVKRALEHSHPNRTSCSAGWGLDVRVRPLRGQARSGPDAHQNRGRWPATLCANPGTFSAWAVRSQGQGPSVRHRLLPPAEPCPQPSRRHRPGRHDPSPQGPAITPQPLNFHLRVHIWRGRIRPSAPPREVIVQLFSNFKFHHRPASGREGAGTARQDRDLPTARPGGTRPCTPGSPGLPPRWISLSNLCRLPGLSLKEERKTCGPSGEPWALLGA